MSCFTFLSGDFILNVTTHVLVYILLRIFVFSTVFCTKWRTSSFSGVNLASTIWIILNLQEPREPKQLVNIQASTYVRSVKCLHFTRGGRGGGNYVTRGWKSIGQHFSSIKPYFPWKKWREQLSFPWRTVEKESIPVSIWLSLRNACNLAL